jgi:NADH-quinone oxidoreductase subunit L
LVTADGTAHAEEFHPGFSVAPVLLGLAGIGLAMRMYGTENTLPALVSERLRGLYRVAYHKFYIDELYLFITRKVIFNLIGRPAAWIDKHIIDGFMNLLGQASLTVSDGISGMQSGKVQSYAAWFLAGILGFVFLTLYLLLAC